MNKHTHQYSDGSREIEYIIESEHALATIDPVGAYVTSWKVKHDGNLIDILYRGSTKKRSGIPILFPYFGKARHTRQHGFGRDHTWKIIHSDITNLSLELKSEDLTVEAQNEYPYKFSAKLNVSVSLLGVLEYSLTIENLDNKDMPISPGIHPYWDIEHQMKKNITVSGLSDFDATTIDWDTNPPDVNYPFDKKVTLHFPTRNIEIKEISKEQKIRHLVVWSQPVDKPDFHFVCFEPVCGVNYTIDDDPILLSPHEIWNMKLHFTAEFK